MSTGFMFFSVCYLLYIKGTVCDLYVKEKVDTQLKNKRQKPCITATDEKNNSWLLYVLFTSATFLTMG